MGFAMFTLPFVIVITGLLVGAYVSAFSASNFARASAVWLVAGAGVIVGGLVSAHMNGGKPYGFDVPFGIERWKQDLPSAPPVVPEEEPGPAIA